MSEEKTGRPELTIVGGQPSKRHRRSGPEKIEVPIGIEKALYHAARDEEFKSRLLEDPGTAIRSVGIRLRLSELALLEAITPDLLETMIKKLVPENPRRRKFMGLVAAAATSLAAGTAVISCDGASGDVLTKGSTGDTDIDGGADASTDADTDTDTSFDVDTGNDTGTDTDTDTDTNTDADSDTGTSPEQDTDTSANKGVGK